MLRLFEGGGDKRPHGNKAVLKRREETWRKKQNQALGEIRNQLLQTDIANKPQTQNLSRMNSVQTLDPTNPFPQNAKILLGSKTYHCQIAIGGALRGGNQFRKKREACYTITDRKERDECLSKYQYKRKPGSESNSRNDKIPQRPSTNGLPQFAQILTGSKKYNCNMILEGGKKKTNRKPVKSNNKKTQRTKKTKRTKK
jgi:hypothetical protein